jgi:hypothetical protein
MRALSIRQPYAELILRGIKVIEYRSRPTRIIGERFYIYAARKSGDMQGFTDIGCTPGDLPTGLIVGTACIAACTRNGSGYEWHLADVRRLTRLRKPTGMPQPVWFNPF